MANRIKTQQDRLYLLEQTGSVVTLPTGSPSVTNSALFTKLTLNNSQTVIKDPSITGSLTEAPGQKGRTSSTWSLEWAMKGGSGPGVLPDMDPVLQAIFGQAATVVATTSVTYNMSDNIQSFTAYRYRTPSTATHFIGVGCVPEKVTWSIGQDVALCGTNGSGVFVIDSTAFSTYSNAEYKFGLASFPAEPSGTRTTNGVFTQGFRGLIQMDGSTVASIKSATITIDTGKKIITDDFGSDIGTDSIGNTRTVSVAFVVDETDAASINDLKQKTQQNALITMTLQVGVMAGSTHTFQLTNVQLSSLTIDRGSAGQFQVSFADATAYGTTALGGTDSITYTIT